MKNNQLKKLIIFMYIVPTPIMNYRNIIYHIVYDYVGTSHAVPIRNYMYILLLLLLYENILHKHTNRFTFF